MDTKLHINLYQGVLEVEGEERFVKEIYLDFKNQLANRTLPDLKQDRINHGEEASKTSQHSIQRKSKKPRTQKVAGGSEGQTKASTYKPSFNANLDLKKLRDFYNQFEPENHPEKILIFAIFLRDTLKISPCSANDIYSCYFTLKDRTKIPQAFVQALRDAENKRGVIKYVSIEDIQIPIAGENYFSELLAKKA